MDDRSTIDMSRPWMDNYAKLLIKICHKHGAFAMGGMSAFTPGKDAETRELQTKKVEQDKARESSIGHDGCWVSHPYFIDIAHKQFTRKNQLDVLLHDFTLRPDLRPRPSGIKTINGLRKNIRVGIAYKHGWNKDIGCVAFDDLMEDLATLEISRAQTWQWLFHKVTLNDGTLVTEKLVHQIFDEECEKIIAALATNFASHEEFHGFETVEQEYLKAKEEANLLFCQKELPEFLCQSSELA